VLSIVMSPRSNEAWLRELTGDRRSQEAALSDLRNLLLRGLRKALAGHGGVDDAFLQDSVQDAMVQVLEHLSRFEGRSRFSTWATSIAIRIALTELRRRRWKDVSFEDLVQDADFVSPAATAADPGRDLSFDRQSIIEKMFAVIRSELTSRQRAALLAELRGMPQDEIARRMGSNRNAVYKLTHDARKRLRRGLTAIGCRAEHIRAAF
jgi:RNA polymerase sigma-70 factor (ECF subfamily)